MPVSAVILIIFDRLLKSLAIKGFFDRPVNLIGDYFRLNFAGNRNIAFSLPFSGRLAEAAILLIIITLVAYLISLYKKGECGQAMLLAAVILGAASNLFDRFKYGFVVDYFDLKYFTVFNLADIAIIVGILFFVKNCYAK